jgi:hypothetical protein
MAKARKPYGPWFDSVHQATGAWEVDLLIAILHTALKDAHKGRGDAISFLDDFLDGLWDDQRKIPYKAQCRRR